MKDKEYVIVELIPEAISPDKGNLAQISALRIKGVELISRFDYRIDEEKLENFDVREMIQYDKEAFTYVNSTEELLKSFKKWAGKSEILILDNEYTNNFLSNIKNKKLFIGEYLNMNYTDDFIERVIEKYKLVTSNYIVDLLYEALISEGNNKKCLSFDKIL